MRRLTLFMPNIKGVINAYDMLYQECLADTPAAIYGDKLRLVRVNIIFQLLLLLLSPDEKLFHNRLIFYRKDSASIGTGKIK